MDIAETIDIAGYELSLEPMTVEDIPRLHELLVAFSTRARPCVSARTRRINQPPAPFSCNRGEVMTIPIEATLSENGNHMAEPKTRPI